MIRLAAALGLLYLSVGAGMTARTAYEALQSRSGYAAHYRPGLFEQVSRNRGLPVVSCMVAADLPIGRWVTVRSGVTDEVRACRVTDVCRPRDCPRLARRGIILEFDYRSGMAMCALRYYGQEPPWKCPVEMWR